MEKEGGWGEAVCRIGSLRETKSKDPAWKKLEGNNLKKSCGEGSLLKGPVRGVKSWGH